MEHSTTDTPTTHTYPPCMCGSGDDISICTHQKLRQILPGISYTPEPGGPQDAYEQTIEYAAELLEEEEKKDLAIIFTQHADDSTRPSTQYFETMIAVYTDLDPGRSKKKGFVGRIRGPRGATIQGALDALADDTSTKYVMQLELDKDRKEWLWRPLPKVEPGKTLSWRLVARRSGEGA